MLVSATFVTVTRQAHRCSTHGRAYSLLTCLESVLSHLSGLLNKQTYTSRLQKVSHSY